MRQKARVNLICARKREHYTQAELANKIGVTLRHYQALEAGTSDGSVKVWQHLKELLEAESIDCLLKQGEEI